MREEDRGKVDVAEVSAGERREAILREVFDPFRACAVVELVVFWEIRSRHDRKMINRTRCKIHSLVVAVDGDRAK